MNQQANQTQNAETGVFLAKPVSAEIVKEILAKRAEALQQNSADQPASRQGVQ